MQSKVGLVIAVIVVAIVGGVAYLLLAPSSPEPTTNSNDTPSTNDRSTLATQQSTQTAAAGSYVDYTANVVAETSGTKLLFFHAPWCPQCRALEADIKTDGVPANVTIIKVDYDSNQSLRQKYGVTLQTTVVRVDDNGNLVEKFVAYDDPSLDAIVKQLL